jgi:hypothetical protein
MISLPQIAAGVVAVGSIGGGALALDRMHVASEDFKEYIEQQQMADERTYVKDLKRDIREIQGALAADPDEEFLQHALIDLIDELCELRPKDRLCEAEYGER